MCKLISLYKWSCLHFTALFRLRHNHHVPNLCQKNDTWVANTPPPSSAKYLQTHSLLLTPSLPPSDKCYLAVSVVLGGMLDMLGLSVRSLSRFLVFETATPGQNMPGCGWKNTCIIQEQLTAHIISTAGRATQTPLLSFDLSHFSFYQNRKALSVCIQLQGSLGPCNQPMILVARGGWGAVLSLIYNGNWAFRSPLLSISGGKPTKTFFLKTSLYV